MRCVVIILHCHHAHGEYDDVRIMLRYFFAIRISYNKYNVYVKASRHY
jgi:hypothetical protein